MTVKELKEQLDKFDDNLTVEILYESVITNDCGEIIEYINDYENGFEVKQHDKIIVIDIT